jgi:hypothetical protein
MTVKLLNERKGNEREFNTVAEAKEQKQKLIELGMSPDNLKIKETHTDGGPEVVDVQPSSVEPDTLSQSPIQHLRGVNTDFVNTIKGTPAISKQGFRFIQRELGITTESKVVETFTEPMGVIVWAKATLPDGHSAEAHGEGYLTEPDVSDNEFVRYADTRAKNRAISDLTASGALAVAEMTTEETQ